MLASAERGRATGHVRPLTVEELPQCLPLARQFWSESNQRTTLDEARTVATWTTILTNKVGVLLALFHEEAIIGMLGGMVNRGFYDGALIAQELFWFIDPDHRGGTGALRLIRAFERWAESQAVSAIYLAHYAHLQGEKLAKVYRRIGYTERETHYARYYQ